MWGGERRRCAVFWSTVMVVVAVGEPAIQGSPDRYLGIVLLSRFGSLGVLICHVFNYYSTCADCLAH